MLGGLTKNYLLANNNTLRKQKEQTGQAGERSVTSLTLGVSRKESVLETLRRGSATPMVSKIVVNDELQRTLNKSK